MQHADHTRQQHHDPFTVDNCAGYTPQEMAALNEEFTQRWNGWTALDAALFLDANGQTMTEEDAIKVFQEEVSRR